MKTIQYNDEKHDYTIDGKAVPSVTTILSYVTSRHYGDISPAVLQQAARRGTLVHEATESMDYGFDVEAEPDIAPYLRAYADFLNTYRPETLFAEWRLHGADEEYAGTLDRLYRVNGELWVVDIKTTGSPTRQNYISYCAQLYAYAKAYDDDSGEGLPKRFILFLKKDGKYRLIDVEEYEKKHVINGKLVWELCLKLWKECEGK